MKREKYLVCCALPYANGPIHLGHLAGAYLPGDIYARFRRLQGHDVHFLCGSDEHGVSITIRAAQEGTTPQAVVDKYHAIMRDSLKACLVEFDVFSRTTYPWHIKRSQEFFTHLMERGLIEKRAEKRLFCETDQKFLPDRYVVGECPHCHAAGARGDQCEKCGSWYEPEELINPICQICGKTRATLRDTTHWYFLMNKLDGELRAWLDSKKTWRKNVLGYANQPLKQTLTARSITRDIEWGIPVPLPDAKGKVLYVWFDAPIGYISASEDWSRQQGDPERWKSYWEDKNTKLIHFIGKDNIIFHSVVWPAILMGDKRYVLPDLVAGNEFLNLEGEKFSTSRNYAIWLQDALQIIDVDLLRYYLTSISPETSDSNFTWAEYQVKVNTELADIIGNLTNRVLTYVNKAFDGIIAPATPLLNEKIRGAIVQSRTRYEEALAGGFSKDALQATVELARSLNVFLQESAPWKTIKQDKNIAHQDLYSVACGIKVVAGLLYPICPTIAQKIWAQLGFEGSIAEASWDELTATPLQAGHKISTAIAPLVAKVEDEFVVEQRAKLQK
jgi:methionyl-tRNA synthetase